MTNRDEIRAMRFPHIIPQSGSVIAVWRAVIQSTSSSAHLTDPEGLGCPRSRSVSDVGIPAHMTPGGGGFSAGCSRLVGQPVLVTGGKST